MNQDALDQWMKDTGIEVVYAPRCRGHGKSTLWNDYLALVRDGDPSATGALDRTDPTLTCWIDETGNITPEAWLTFEALFMLKQNRSRLLSLGIANALAMPPQSKVLQIDNAGVTLDHHGKTIKPAQLLNYDVFTGDVYLCTFQAIESSVTGHMEGAAKFAMHRAMMDEFTKMTGEHLRHHAEKRNPYALHIQSVRANDGDLIKSELPPKFESIRFVLAGAAA